MNAKSRVLKAIIITILFLMASSAFAAGDAKHYPGIFLGGTNFDGETDFTFGIEYEYKFSKQFGFGAVWERSIEGHDGDGVNVVVGSIFYHPTDQWRLGLGFGEEQIRGYKPKNKDLWRISGTYEYAMDNIIIAPTLALDFIDSEKATVFGVAILVPF